MIVVIRVPTLVAVIEVPITSLVTLVVLIRRERYRAVDDRTLLFI